jgi:hypothetical protein
VLAAAVAASSCGDCLVHYTYSSTFHVPKLLLLLLMMKIVHMLKDLSRR